MEEGSEAYAFFDCGFFVFAVELFAFGVVVGFLEGAGEERLQVDGLGEELAGGGASGRSWAVAVGSPVERKLRRRNSSGERPTTLAILSMWRSRAKMLCGAPKPRKAPWGGILVAMALARTVRWGQW